MKNNRQTRKRKVKILTIPQLRNAFEQIDHEIKRILAKHPINESSIKEFQSCWKKIFGKQIDTNTAGSYLEIQSKTKKTNKNRTIRKQRGGVAPVDFQTRPGIDGTHGTFLPYISSGFKFYDQINNIAMDSSCGKENISPSISQDMGSNQVHKGGQRLIAPTVPSSIFQDIQDKMSFRPLGDSPDPTQTHYRRS